MTHINKNAQRILSSPDFKKLVKYRNAVRFGLSLMVFALHAFFVGGIAFYNQWFGSSLSDNSSIPRGIFYAIIIIVAMLLLEFIYIKIGEKVFDPLQKKVASEKFNNE